MVGSAIISIPTCISTSKGLSQNLICIIVAIDIHKYMAEVRIQDRSMGQFQYSDILLNKKAPG